MNNFFKSWKRSIIEIFLPEEKSCTVQTIKSKARYRISERRSRHHRGLIQETDQNDVIRIYVWFERKSAENQPLGLLSIFGSWDPGVFEPAIAWASTYEHIWPGSIKEVSSPLAKPISEWLPRSKCKKAIFIHFCFIYNTRFLVGFLAVLWRHDN
jgi:hypothetical protein